MPPAPQGQKIDFGAINFQPTTQKFNPTPTPQQQQTNLTPYLSKRQLLENIDALKAQGIPDQQIQKYVDNYKSTPTGYALKTATAVSEQSKQQQPQDLLGRITGAAQNVTNFLGLKGATDTLGQNFADVANPGLQARFGDAPTTLKQNIGAGLQIGASTALPGKAPLSIAKSIGLGATQGGSIGAGKAASENQSTQEIARQAGIGGAVGGTFAGVTSLVGKFLERAGDKIQYSIIKPTKADIEDGFKIDTVKKFNLGGSLTNVLTKTESTMDDLSRQLNDKLATSDQHINMNSVLEKTIAKLNGNKLTSFGSNTSQETAINQLKSELSQIGTDVTIPEAQIIKRASGHYGAWQYGMFDPDSTARQKVYNVFYNEMKKAIEDSSPPGVREINKQMSELIPVLNAAIRRLPIAERNNALSLTDIIGLVGSAVEPRALGVTMINLLSKSGTVGDILSRVGPRIGNAAPVVGAEAALLGEAFSPTTPAQQQTQEIKPTTSSNTTTDKFKERYGMTEEQWKAKYGKYVEGAVGMGAVKAETMAAYALKDAVISALEKGPKSLPGHLNDAALKEVPDIIKSLKEVKGANTEAVNRALEVLRLMGHDTQKLVTGSIQEAQAGLMQLHDALGRFTRNFGPKK